MIAERIYRENMNADATLRIGVFVPSKSISHV